ncbi:hypothetical protein NQ317_007431 [Molorchus minor]|uniref:Carboxypeptidase n=1 Tax=Molorchus minor TaxID=1323400 RepID=A0ABQ9JHB7_9CUCU|nr:hypothetical protein NQ317_007431 [Molorchus minor]
MISYQFPNGNFQQEPVKSNPDDDPLILTPLIDQNKIEEAKQAARVNPDMFLGVESYSGFFTVNKEYNFHKSNMFFWFFPSENNYGNDPVILWLQGALNERSSSLFGLFMENGPFSVNSDHQLVPREYSWTKNHSVLYIDNPVGAGYSFTNDLYAKNQTEVGKDLYNALQQFFKLFSELRENDFFIIGESYAGKYIPAIGYTILKENLKAENKINLQGLAIGNGFSDPIHQIDYSDYLYQLGILDRNVRKSLKENENEDLTRHFLTQNAHNFQAVIPANYNLQRDSSVANSKITNIATSPQKFRYPRYSRAFSNSATSRSILGLDID